VIDSWCSQGVLISPAERSSLLESTYEAYVSAVDRTIFLDRCAVPLHMDLSSAVALI